MNLPTGAKTTSIASGPNLPAECRPEAANVFFKTTSPIGMHQCLTEGEWSEIAGGGGGSVTLAEHQIGFGSASNTATGDAGFTFDPAGVSDYLHIDVVNTTSAFMDAPIKVDLDYTASADNGGAYGADFSSFVGGDGHDGVYAIGLGTTIDGEDVEVVKGAEIVVNATSASEEAIGIDVQFSIGSSPANVGLKISDVNTPMATTNRAIQTGLGDIVFGSLAGTGSRAVVVDANGKLSAP